MPPAAQQREAASTQSGANTTKPPELGAASAVGRSLAGKGFAEQAALLSPAGQGAAPKPTDPAGSALILSRDATYQTAAYLPWFADRLKGTMDAWGLPFDPASVRLAKDGDASVVALDWQAAWGAAPTAREANDMMLSPVDARAATAAVTGLPGWAQVPAADRSILAPLLGGETNQLSGAARGYLRPKFLELKGKPDAEQAAALSAVIGARDATPSLSGEDVKSTPVTLTLGAPQESPGYAFRGLTADALITIASYSDGASFEIVAAKELPAGVQQHAVQDAAEAARYLPQKNRALVKTIVLSPVVNPEDAHWATEYNMPDFHSYMTAGSAGVVTVYPSNTGPQPSVSAMRGSLIHETGHTWSYKQWGEDKTQGKWLDWQRARDTDRVSVSTYAMASIGEDVAETVQIYGSTKGTPKHLEYKAMVPARFAILDAELG